MVTPLARKFSTESVVIFMSRVRLLLCPPLRCRHSGIGGRQVALD